MRVARLLAVGAALLPAAATSALAFEPEGSPSDRPGRAEAADPLGGPTVRAEAETPDTLIRRGYDGKLRPLEAPPALEALRLLELTDEERAAVDDVLAERWALLDGIIRRHALLLSEVEPTLAAGSPMDKLDVIRRGMEALEPLRAWGKLPVRIAAALPAAKATRYRALVTEYERAIYDELIETGEADNAIAVRMTRYWTDLGWEIERSAERVFQEDDGDGLAKLVEALELTPEQEASVRAKAEAAYLEAGGLMGEAEETALFFEIVKDLSWGQRLKLLGMAARGELDDGDEMAP